MEDAFIVNGGRKLTGEITLSGAKNEALKIIIASLIFDNEITIYNVPTIGDILELIALLKSLGVDVSFIGTNTLHIKPIQIKKYVVDLLHGSKMRVSFLLFAPFLARFGKARIPNPGGCRIGARPIDRQISIMRAFGIEIDYDSKTGYYEASLTKKLQAINYKFEKPSHTGTELALMFATIATGKTTITNAAQEPEIDDFIEYLAASGVKIKKNKDVITVESTGNHHVNSAKHTVSYDRNEAVTYAIFALATQGNITIKKTSSLDLKYFLDKVTEVGGNFEVLEDAIRFYYTEPFKHSSVTTAPHPGFMTDWQAPWSILMTQAVGQSIIHETVFENRFSYVSELRKLGAKIDFFEPEMKENAIYQFNGATKSFFSSTAQAIKINGPTNLHNGFLQVSDLRAGASLLIAACVARGESIVEGASIIDRGYEEIDKKLKSLGAMIKRV